VRRSPFGIWTSPISAAAATAGESRADWAAFVGEKVWCTESRPAEVRSDGADPAGPGGGGARRTRPRLESVHADHRVRRPLLAPARRRSRRRVRLDALGRPAHVPDDTGRPAGADRPGAGTTRERALPRLRPCGRGGAVPARGNLRGTRYGRWWRCPSTAARPNIPSGCGRSTTTSGPAEAITRRPSRVPARLGPPRNAVGRNAGDVCLGRRRRHVRTGGRRGDLCGPSRVDPERSEMMYLLNDRTAGERE